MRFDSIQIENFQGHKSLSLEFSPTVSVLIGPTDTGKSSVLRALRWLCLNDLSGDAFIRDGAKSTAVTASISFPDKSKFEITRGKSNGGANNFYTLQTGWGKIAPTQKQEFKSFSTGVPKPIADLLSTNEFNFQAQFDAPLWFSNTGGEVSRQMNAVIDLSLIDTALFNVGQEVRRGNERVALCEERLNASRTHFEAANAQRQRVTDFNALQVKSERLQTLQERTDKLKRTIKDIDENRAGEKEKQSADLEALFQSCRVAYRLERKRETLRVLIADIESQSVVAPPDFAPIENAMADYVGKIEQSERLRNLIACLEKAETNLSGAENNFEICEKRFHREAKGKTCPTCGQQII